MKTEEKKDTETKTRDNGSGCCKPENFEKMLEMMGECCQGKSDSIDFSALMKSMMGMCSGSTAGDTKSDCENC